MKTVWTTKNGQRIKIKDMTDSHLLFTQRLLRRNAARWLDDEIKAAWSCLGMLQGEMAQYYCEGDIDRLESTDSEDFLSSRIPCYDNLCKEIAKRKLKELPI